MEIIPKPQGYYEKRSTSNGVSCSPETLSEWWIPETTHDSWPHPGRPGNLGGRHSVSSWGYTSLVGDTRIQIGHSAHGEWGWRQSWHLLEEKVLKIHFLVLISESNQLNVVGNYSAFRMTTGARRQMWTLDREGRLIRHSHLILKAGPQTAVSDSRDQWRPSPILSCHGRKQRTHKMDITQSSKSWKMLSLNWQRRGRKDSKGTDGRMFE